MRKLIIFLLLSSMLILTACQPSNDPAAGTETTDYELHSSKSYTEFVSESQAIFGEMIRNNPIDRDYCNEVTDGTTLGLRDRENKYAQLWLQELSFSYDSLLDVLDEEDKADFIRMNDAWKATLDAEMEFVSDFSEENAAPQGSVFLVELASHYRECIRERALYMKYLLFLQEGKVVFFYSNEAA